MRSRREVAALLDQLETCVADDLEDQDLDLKQGAQPAAPWAAY